MTSIAKRLPKALAAGLALLSFTAAHAQPARRPGDDPAVRAEARDIFSHVIAMDTSVEGNRVPAMAAYLARKFRAAGFPEADIHIMPLDKTAALVVRYRGDGTGGRPILLMAHMDVVTAHRADWRRDPFTLTEENGYFYGRGAFDIKNGLATLTETFLQLRRRQFKPTRDLIIYFSGDEEITGLTTQAVLRDHRDWVNAEFALNSDSGGGALNEKTGAPEAYALDTSEKTFASYTFTAHNPGGHSSLPRPDNAIYDIVDALSRVRGYTFPVVWNDTTIAYFKATGAVTPAPIGPAMIQFAAHPGDPRAAAVLSADPSFVGKVRTTCIPTLVQGGHADNALPQSVVATVNCRIFPGVTIEAVQARLQELAGTQVAVAPLDKYFSSDASPLRPDVLAAVTSAVHLHHPGVPIIPSMASGASDGVFFRGAGIPTYGVYEAFIKRSEDFSHGLDERVPVKSFYEGLDHWDVLLRTLASPSRPRR